ncbi:hypothetical protein [Porticoccus sp.]|uniref:hypothetical protein n=1 Tax=Porticoccus sp. TaxID=2024853 RepID=UPI003F6A29E6
MITVATYSFPHEAHIAKLKLDAKGIPAFVADEHTINMQWLYSSAMGGVKLKVPAPFADQATEALAEDFSDLFEDEAEDDPERRACPSCGSLEMSPYIRGRKPAFLVFLLLGFPLFFYKRGLRCAHCGTFVAL